MYYFGVYLSSDPSTPSAYLLMEKQLKGLKKEYHILDLNDFPSSATLADIEEKVRGIYHDRSLITMKKRFSQDRRPSKKVAILPTLVCGVENIIGDPFSETRKKEIPVERVIFCAPPEESGAPRELTLGCDVYVQREAAFQAFQTVCSQGRLKGDDAFFQATFPDPVSRSLPAPEMFSVLKDRALFSRLMVQALLLWFTETVRRIKRY